MLALNETPRIVTLVVGGVTGFAVGAAGHVMSSFVPLAGRGVRNTGPARLAALLDQLRVSCAPNLLVIQGAKTRRRRRQRGSGELVRFATEWAEKHGIRVEAYAAGTVKKSWTGNGNASKEAMVAEAVRRSFGVARPEEAQAVALFDLALRRTTAAA